MFSALEKYDCLISPAAPTAAYPVGGKVSDPLSMYKEDLMTVSLNLSGLPAVVVPCGFSKEEGEAGAAEVVLPVGLQMIGKMFGERELLAAAHVFETARAAAGNGRVAHKPQVVAA
jgi:aspartyl-tRNA(Asn)/glutamyl-tRNA(Gln) amidotransferase subunit A